MKGPSWTTTEEKLLRTHWHDSSWDQLLEMFPGRTKIALAKRASEMKLPRRDRRVCGPVHPILVKLEELRRHKRISYGEMSYLSGYFPTTISSWTQGRYVPNIVRISDLAEVLGLEIVLRDKQSGEVIT